MATYTIPTKTYIDAQDALKMTTSEYLTAVGNINSPLLDIPLKNSLAMKAGVGSATFTRASTATYIDRYGVLKTAAIDEPRFEKEGYLNEGSSTNLFLRSEEFDHSGWNKSYSTVSANTTDTLDPYGTNFADKIIDNTANNLHGPTMVVPYTAGVSYTVSGFFKAGTLSACQLRLPSAAFGTAAILSIDLLTGSVIGQSGPISGYNIQALANGWYRISVSAVATSTISTATPAGYLVNEYSSYLGDGTGSIYMFGAQLEALPFATSYIPTTSATVTRAADILNVTKVGNVPNLEKNGVISAVFDFDFLGSIPSSTPFIWGIYQSATDNIGAYVSSSKYVASAVNSIADSNTTIYASALSEYTKYRIAQVVNNSGNNIYINGIFKAYDADTDDSISSTLNTNVSSIRIGSHMPSNIVNSAILFGHISNFRIYDKALTSQEAALA